MNPHRLTIAALTAAVALGVAGCSSPDSRIRAKPELFATFPADVQQSIRTGQIGVGFSEDMVRMAAGRPDRVVLRLTETGTNTVWLYTRPDTRNSGRFFSTTTYLRDGHGRIRPVPDLVWVDDYYWRSPTETVRMRIEFREGKVTAVEAVK